jgi:hypothetical protein
MIGFEYSTLLPCNPWKINPMIQVLPDNYQSIISAVHEKNYFIVKLH